MALAPDTETSWQVISQTTALLTQRVGPQQVEDTTMPYNGVSRKPTESRRDTRQPALPVRTQEEPSEYPPRVGLLLHLCNNGPRIKPNGFGSNTVLDPARYGFFNLVTVPYTVGSRQQLRKVVPYRRVSGLLQRSPHNATIVTCQPFRDSNWKILLPFRTGQTSTLNNIPRVILPFFIQ